MFWFIFGFLFVVFFLVGFFFLLGFWGKFLVIKVSLVVELYWFVVIVLLVGLLMIFLMIKIWNEVFWKDVFVVL